MHLGSGCSTILATESMVLDVAPQHTARAIAFGQGRDTLNVTFGGVAITS